MKADKARQLADIALAAIIGSPESAWSEQGVKIEQAILQACNEQREIDAGIAENEGCDQSEYRCATVERIAAAIRRKD
jgi:hypothetical protein